MSDSEPPSIWADLPTRAASAARGGPAQRAPALAGPRGDPRDLAEAVYRQAAALDRRFAPHAAVALEPVDELGRGGMGLVTRVVDRRLEREAALKRLLPRRARDPQARALFEREVVVTALLNHPAIPPVYEAGADARGEPYMLMRLVDGQTYDDLIAAHHQRGAPSRAAVLEVLLKVSDAVAYAHSRGVVHCDLKPANVMVGRFGEVLVMDWGLALTREARGPQAPRASVGTPGYMSPEQAGAGALDERTDVFALGAMLVTALTGEPPFAGDPINRIAATLRGRATLPRERRPDAPRELHSLAASALASLEQRLASAGDFSANLRAFLAGERVPVHRYTFGERLAGAVRRRPGRVAAGLVGGVLCASTGLLGMQLARAAEAEARAEAARSAEERRRRQAEARERASERERRLAQARSAEAEAVRARLERALTALQEARTLARRYASPAEVRARVEAALASEPVRAVRGSAAEVYRQAGMFEEARALLEALIASAPGDRPPYEELLLLHGIEVELTGLDLVVTEPLERLERLARARGDENELTAFVAALRAVFARDDAAALRELERALQLNPTLAYALASRAALHYRHQRYPQALADAARALQLAPELTSAHAARGYALLRQGHAAQARVAFDAALQRSPDQSVLLGGRAEARLQLRDFHGALRDAEDALRAAAGDGRDPLLRDIWVTAAQAELELDRAQAALERLRQTTGSLSDMRFVRVLARALVELEEWGQLRQLGEHVAAARPDGAIGPLLIGKADSRTGRFAEAREHLERAVERGGGDPVEALHERGRVLLRLGELAGARRDLARVLELEPRRHEAWIYVGWVALLEHRPEAAEQAAARALALEPLDGGALALRATARRRLGLVDEALEDVTVAFELGRAPGESYPLRGDLRAAVGDREGARRDYRSYLERFPEAGDAAEVRARLAALE